MSAPPADPRIERILKAMPGIPSLKLVRALEGGISNRNYLLAAGEEKYVLRIGGEGTALLGIDRRREHAASTIAAQLGVGAEVVAFVEKEGALLTRFIEGRAITPQAAREDETLGRIVESVQRYHLGPAFPGSFSPFETVRRYAALARKYRVRFPEGSARAMEVMERIERAMGPPEEPFPCHNDLLAGNFIDDGRRMRILDWEYAAMGDPFFDLGNLAANQELGREECERVIEVYFGKVESEELARLHLMRLASDMREAFWGVLQMGISQIEFDYEAYARKHLERFLQAAEAPELPEWMEEVEGGSRGCGG